MMQTSHKFLIRESVVILVAALAMSGAFMGRIGLVQRSDGITILQKVSSVNDVVNTDLYAIETTKVAVSSEFDPAFTIAEDEVLLYFDLSLKNMSDQVQQFFPVNQLFIRNRQGGYYPMHPSIKLRNPIQSGDLAPGETRKGQVSFAVPNTIVQPLLFIDLGWNDSSPSVTRLF